MPEFRKKLLDKKAGAPIFAVPKNTEGSVVQLVRMPPCHGGGRGFESRPVRKKLAEKRTPPKNADFWGFFHE